MIEKINVCVCVCVPQVDLTKLQFRQREHDRSLSGSSKGIAYPAPLASAMAAFSGDDVPTQLAALLGRGTVQIRKTNETPPRISIIDVAIAVTGKTHHDAAQDYRRLLNQYPEVGTNWFHLKFPGRGQRDSGKGFEFSGPREIK